MKHASVLIYLRGLGNVCSSQRTANNQTHMVANVQYIS